MPFEIKIRHHWSEHRGEFDPDGALAQTGQNTDWTMKDEDVANAILQLERVAGELELRTSSELNVVSERQRHTGRLGGDRSPDHFGGGETYFYDEITTIVAGSAAALAALIKTITPLVKALLDNRAGASLEVKVGDVEIKLQGTNDVDRALKAIDAHRERAKQIQGGNHPGGRGGAAPDDAVK